MVDPGGYPGLSQYEPRYGQTSLVVVAPRSPHLVYFEDDEVKILDVLAYMAWWKSVGFRLYLCLDSHLLSAQAPDDVRALAPLYPSYRAQWQRYEMLQSSMMYQVNMVVSPPTMRRPPSTADIAGCPAPRTLCKFGMRE